MAVEKKISQEDIEYLRLIRENVRNFLKDASERYSFETILDIGPQNYLRPKEFFTKSRILTMDIDPNSGADFVADICCDNSDKIASDYFDCVVCTEVLEHTLNPLKALSEIHRILRPGGVLLASAPFNFRIHGPLPDCWRFTEHGWRALLTQTGFKEVSIKSLETENRFLMPIHYTVEAEAKK